MWITQVNELYNVSSFAYWHFATITWSHAHMVLAPTYDILLREPAPFPRRVTENY
jgi:hypothetical protein